MSTTTIQPSENCMTIISNLHLWLVLHQVQHTQVIQALHLLRILLQWTFLHDTPQVLAIPLPPSTPLLQRLLHTTPTLSTHQTLPIPLHTTLTSLQSTAVYHQVTPMVMASLQPMSQIWTHSTRPVSQVTIPKCLDTTATPAIYHPAPHTILHQLLVVTPYQWISSRNICNRHPATITVIVPMLQVSNIRHQWQRQGLDTQGTPAHLGTTNTVIQNCIHQPSLAIDNLLQWDWI